MRRLISVGVLELFIVILLLACSSKDDSKATPEPIIDFRANEVVNSEMNAFEKAVKLRRIIADTLDAGVTSDSLCLNFAAINFNEFVVDSFLQKFATNSGTGMCGLAGSILAKTLNNHGIEAYTYNYGFKNSRLTHIVVLAKTTDTTWTLHDPFFNYSIMDSSGLPKDFFSMMEELGQKNHANISFTNDTVTRQVLTDSTIPIPNIVSSACVDYLTSTLSKKSGPEVLEKRICYTCGYDSVHCPELNFFHNMSTRMANHGLPTNAVYGLFFQINTVWGPNPNMMQAKLDSLFDAIKRDSLVGVGS